MMIKKWFILAFLSVGFLACTNKNTDLYTPPEELENGATTGSAKIIVHEPNRDVDILFVIDQSTSMASIIKEVHANIDRFAEVFTSDEKNKINFRIGVTTAWDSNHFEQVLKKQWQDNKGLYQENSEIWPDLNFDLVQGRLQPVKIDGKTNNSRPPYISQDLISDPEELISALRETLKVKAQIHQYKLNDDGTLRGVFDYYNPGGKFLQTSKENIKENFVLYGPSPENEEFFSTIFKMTNDTRGTLYNQINNQFPNPEANQLAIFIITDAEDDVHERTSITIKRSSKDEVVPMAPEHLYNHLVSFMGNDKSKVAIYGALYESGRETCKVRALDKNGQFIIDPDYIDGYKAANGLPPSYADTPKESFLTIEKERDPGLEQDRRGPKKIERLIQLAELSPLNKKQLIEKATNLNLERQTKLGGLTKLQLIELITGSSVKSDNVKSICSDDFGAELASVGFKIKEQVLQQEDVIIDVRAEYDKTNLRVYYGDPKDENNRIPHDTEKGWSHVSSENTSSLIKVSKNAYQYDENKTFHVLYENFTFKNQTKGIKK